MALTRLGPNNSTNISGINLTSQVTGTLPTGNGGTGATSFAPGKVLQAVTATITNSTQGTTSSSFVASSLELNITPSATSSKILVMMNGGQAYTGGAGKYMNVTIYRDSTNLGQATRGMGTFTVGADTLSTPHSFHYLDSPSSSSQLNYKAYYRSDDGSTTVYFSTGSAGTMSLTAMEIGA
jgi:hypothetical protein